MQRRSLVTVGALGIAMLLLAPAGPLAGVAASGAEADTEGRAPPEAVDRFPAAWVAARPEVDDATGQRFLEAWAARFAEPEGFSIYMASPDNLQDEFASLSGPAKLELTARFLGELWAHDAEFRARVHPAEQTSAWAGLEAAALWFWHGVLFDKAALRAALQGGGAQGEDAGHEPPEARAEPSPPSFDPLTGEVLPGQDALAERLEATRAPPALPAAAPADSPVLDLLERAAEGRLSVPPELARLRPDAQPVEPPFLEPLAFPFPDAENANQGQPLVAVALPSQDTRLPAWVLAPQAALPADVGAAPVEAPAAPALPDPVLDPPSSPAAVQAFLRALSYTACSQMAGGSVRCFPGSVPFGVPVGLDVDGSPVTGVAGIDVVVDVIPTLVPGALAWSPGAQPSAPPLPLPPPPSNPTQVQAWFQAAAAQLQQMARDGMKPGIAATLRVQVLPPSAPQPRNLPAKVWVVYGIADPDTGAVDKVLRVGVDGSAPGTRLPEVTGLTLKVKDLVQLVQGRALATLNANFDKPGASVALFAAFNDMNAQGQPVNPTTVTARLEPVVNLAAEVDARLDGSRYVGTLSPGGSTKFTVAFESQRGSPPASTRAEVTLDKLPGQVTVEYERLSDGQRVRYDASSSVARLTAGFERIDTERVAGTLDVSNLPDAIEVLYKPGDGKGSASYLASSPVPLVTGTFSRTASGTTTSGSFAVASVPARVELSWDMDARRLDWRASAAVDRVSLAATLPTTISGTWSVAADLLMVPAQWSASFPDGSFAFDSPAGIGSVRVAASNAPAPAGAPPCGLVAADPPQLAPNRFCAILDQPGKSVDVELVLAQVRHASFARAAGGDQVVLEAGGGQRFVATLNATRTPTDRVLATLDIAALPRSITITTGDIIDYRASDYPDVVLSVTRGDPVAFAAVPTPPLHPLGIAVRDGMGAQCFPTFCTFGIATKVRASITGFPASLRVASAGPDSFAVDITDWRPKSTRLVLDVDKAHPTRLYAYATVDNFAPAAGASQSFHAAYTTYEETFFVRLQSLASGDTQAQAISDPIFPPPIELPTETRRITVIDYTSASAIGPVLAQVVFPEGQARVEVSQVPARVHIEDTEEHKRSHIAYSAGAPIARAYVAVSRATGAPATSFQLAATLTDVPATIDLLTARGKFGTILNYTASASTLDVALSREAALLKADETTRMLAGFTNLGAVVRTTNSDADKRFDITSTPATQYAFVEVHGALDPPPKTDGKSKCVTFVAQWCFNWSYTYDFDVTVRKLRLELEKLTSLTFDYSFYVLARVKGTYERLSLTWRDLDLTMSLAAHVDVEACITVSVFGYTAAKGCLPLFSLSPGLTLPTIHNVWFHVANDHHGPFPVPGLGFTVCVGVSTWLGRVDVARVTVQVQGGLGIRPDPSHGESFNGFTTYGTGSSRGDGGNAQWYLLADLNVARFGFLNQPMLSRWVAATIIMGLAALQGQTVGLSTSSLSVSWSATQGC